MKTTSVSIAVCALFALSACAPAAPTATFTPPPTDTSVPPSPTPAPTFTPEPSETPFPPTPTPTPLRVLLRRHCGGEYLVTADKPVQILYGGWGVIGRDLAEQWMTNLEVDLTIDGLPVPGELQPVADELPWNCTQDKDNLYWLYYSVVLPGLSSGQHAVTVTYRALRPLADGSGQTFGPGEILRQDFTLDVR